LNLSAKVTFADAQPIPDQTQDPFVLRIAAVVLAAVFIALCAAVEGRSATFDQATLAASKSLEAKMRTLDSKETHPSASYPAVVITEYEANSYLKVHSGEFLPPACALPH